ncbi:MAG: DUF4340 domain-containing protein [Acidimicrobiia bacterium]|nr:DUF4340 domain-containing protein [Acidimicrobiia bacterium]
MKELLKTFLFCLVAALLVAAALRFDNAPQSPQALNDEGQLFYPAFTDPQAPKMMEVIDYDEATATARPLKVEFRRNRWVIPSHFGYPADAEQRLASTAAALIDLRKDAIVSDRADDHARFGVIDPLDAKVSSLVGRGKRVTLRDASNATLADFVIGKPVEAKAGFRYLRLPGQRRTYAVKTDADASARFQDWIETDLLKLSAADIRKIGIRLYSINETFGLVENRETIVLTREDGKWIAEGGGSPKKSKMDGLLQALDSLRIVDVQAKPLGLSQDLKTPEGIRLSPDSILSLRQKGFFVTPRGQLLSNEGEVTVETANGLLYSLRFGEVASGGTTGPAPPPEGQKETPAAGKPASQPKGEGERRYLFITVGYNEERAEKYSGGLPASGRGPTLERELRNRFADWYYIISGADFQKLRPSRKDLIQ